MEIGLNYRNWGPHATRENLVACARIADESTLDSIWVNDHIGFPPGDWSPAYVPRAMGAIIDPFAMMAFLSAITSRITFGPAVVVGPYRPPLPTAKWLQSIQVLSGERMCFGVGAGYMDEEFTALGIDKRRRGALTDELLDLLHKSFGDGEVECHGQTLVLEPRPKRPPFLIGGVPQVAMKRALARGDGWMPVGILPAELSPLAAEFQARAAEAGRGTMQVVVMKTLPLERPSEAVEMALAYREAGATGLVHTQAYDDPAAYRDLVASVCETIQAAVRSM